MLDKGNWWINGLFLLLDKKATPLAFLTRDLMENVTNYVDAVTLLEKSDLIAPAYFIIGGVEPDEGAVITRNQFEVVNTWNLDSQSEGIDKWYLIETNYDHWTEPPKNDDRVHPGMNAMNAITQANIDYETLFDVMSLVPVCNQ